MYDMAFDGLNIDMNELCDKYPLNPHKPSLHAWSVYDGHDKFMNYRLTPLYIIHFIAKDEYDKFINLIPSNNILITQIIPITWTDANRIFGED